MSDKADYYQASHSLVDLPEENLRIAKEEIHSLRLKLEDVDLDLENITMERDELLEIQEAVIPNDAKLLPR